MTSRKRKEIEKKRKKNAAKIALAIMGVGIVTGVTVVVGLHGIMKKIFVNENWPDEEWSNDDWAEEELEN